MYFIIYYTTRAYGVQFQKSALYIQVEYTKGYTELLSLHAIQARNASNQKKKKTAYSVVHYLSDKCTMNTVS